MKCMKCGVTIVPREHYVELEDGEIMDEHCFFEMALEHFNAKNLKRGSENSYSDYST